MVGVELYISDWSSLAVTVDTIRSIRTELLAIVVLVVCPARRCADVCLALLRWLTGPRRVFKNLPAFQAFLAVDLKMIPGRMGRGPVEEKADRCGESLVRFDARACWGFRSEASATISGDRSTGAGSATTGLAIERGWRIYP